MSNTKTYRVTVSGLVTYYTDVEATDPSAALRRAELMADWTMDHTSIKMLDDYEAEAL